MTIEACPFCGNKAKVRGSYSERYNRFYIYVQCLKCGAKGKTYTSNTDYEPGEECTASIKAIEAWNTRANVSPTTSV